MILRAVGALLVFVIGTVGSCQGVAAVVADPSFPAPLPFELALCGVAEIAPPHSPLPPLPPCPPGLSPHSPFSLPCPHATQGGKPTARAQPAASRRRAASSGERARTTTLVRVLTSRSVHVSARCSDARSAAAASSCDDRSDTTW